ncbi:Glycerate dehydrogenase [Ceratocystis platani]|uniref:Glycerate dehydrogenase n=1 Tax=Ceratocystis fimbriata f. sp. platani TaxID=88771 RepID=A0A0F8BSR9_CERFI|nr:Glycerate dehydrogenase [Ceratocystis platani]
MSTSPPPKKHHIVVLELVNSPSLSFDFPHTIEYYEVSTNDQIGDRIKDATIVIASTTPITAAHLAQAPKLECIAITATGIEFVDRALFAKAGITVTNCPQSNVDAVGEHFLALYFACRRKVVRVHDEVTGENRTWVKKGLLMSLWEQGPPLSCAQETLGIIGYGALGKKIETLARGVGFNKILIADRKDASTARSGRTLFRDVIASATTIVVCCPKSPDTIGLVSSHEFSEMRPEALVLNLARGGIVCEKALANALTSGRIFGAGVDVLEKEPAGRGTSPLIPDPEKGEEPIPNLTISGHVAWYSAQTLVNLRRMLEVGVQAHVKGDMLENPESKATAVVYRGEIFR